MIRRNKNKNKNKNNNNKQRGNGAQQLKLYKPVMDLPMARDVNLQFQVFAVFNQPAAITMYSFSSSTTQVTPTLRQDLGAALVSSTEFNRYAGDFAFYKWKAVAVTCSNNIFGSNVLVSNPPLFYRIAPLITGTVTADGVGRSDNAIEYKVSNLGRQYQSYHPFPGTIIGALGNVVGGSDIYLPTNLSQTTQFELQIGNITNPDFTGAASAFVKLVTIDVICKVIFASPYVL